LAAGDLRSWCLRVGDLIGAPKGLFLILDYPEEKLDQTKALLRGLAERKSATYALRVLFLSRRSFAEWEQETLLLEGRFGHQEIAAPSPLSVDDGVKLIEEAAGNFAVRSQKGVPDFRDARRWLEASPTPSLCDGGRDSCGFVAERSVRA
jgi:hypothetical protein